MGKSEIDLVTALNKTPLRDLLVNTGASLTSSVPVLGSITALARDFIPSLKEQRLIDFVVGLNDDLMKLSQKINEEYVRTEEFAYLFEQVLRRVLDNYQAEKICAYRAILTRSLTENPPRFDRAELVMSIVDGLSAQHMTLLAVMVDPQGYNEFRGSPVRGGNSITQVLRQLLPEYTEFELDFLWKSLYQSGLLNTDSTRTMMSASGMRILEGRLTDIGNMVVGFITLP